MGQNTRDQAGSADRLGGASEEAHCTLARRIMQCGEEVAGSCVNRRTITRHMLGYVNSSIVDCLADCIDILREETRDASVNNR